MRSNTRGAVAIVVTGSNSSNYCGWSATTPSSSSSSSSSPLLRFQRRYQTDASQYAGASSVAGGRRVGRGYENPLAAKDPAQRSVTIPNTFHGNVNNAEDEGGVQEANVLHKNARKALMQQLDSNLLWRGTVVSDRSHWVAKHFIKCRTDPRYRQAKERLVLSGRLLLKELAESSQSYPSTLLITKGSPIPAWLGQSADGGRGGERIDSGDAATAEETAEVDDEGNDALGDESTSASKKRKKASTANEPTHETVITPMGEPCEIIRVSEGIANEIDPANDGYIGDYAMPTPPPIEDLIANTARHERVLVLDNVTDPGQLGTMLRTAAALNYDAVLMVNHCADYYNHAVVRASRGVQFLPHSPYYVIRDEDGDDAYGLINHIINRNDMESVAFTPNPTSAWKSSSSSVDGGESAVVMPAHSPFAAARQLLKRKPVATTAPVTPHRQQMTPPPTTATPLPSSAPAPTTTPPTKKSANSGGAAVAARLSSFLLDAFASKPSPSHSHTGGDAKQQQEPPSPSAPPGKSFMVFAGPDHTRTLIPTLERKVIRPTTVLQLDEQQQQHEEYQSTPGSLPVNANNEFDDALAIADFSTTFPVVLYAMRPKGDWDFLTPQERENRDLAGKGAGTHYDRVGWDLNHPQPESFDEEQQMEKAMDEMLWKVNKRAIHRGKTDHGHYLDTERRIHRLRGRKEEKGTSDPLFAYTGDGRAFFNRPEPKLPDAIPNITTDFMEHAGRDTLAQEQRLNDKRFTNWMDDIPGATEEGAATTVTDIYNQNGKFQYQTPNGTRRAPR